MASIKLGAYVTEIRGKVGGTVFSKSANGSYTKNFSKPVNTNTGRQQTVRGLFSQVSQYWRQLSDEEREAWAAAAPEFPYQNRVGETSTYTGSQLFAKLNMARFQQDPGAEYMTNPPSPSSLTAIYSAVATLATDSPNVNITITINGGTGLGAGQLAYVMATRGLSQGVYRPKDNVFKLLGSFAVSNAGVVDTPAQVLLDAAYIAKFGVPATGSAVWFKLMTFEPETGQLIPGTMVKVTVTAV